MPAVCVDWDGTLWRDGDWLPGGLVALAQFQHDGLRVVVHTARASFDEGAAEVRRQLGLVGLAAVEVVAKPAAVAYVDDRAVVFDGDWYSCIERVRVLREGRKGGLSL